MRAYASISILNNPDKVIGVRFVNERIPELKETMLHSLTSNQRTTRRYCDEGRNSGKFED